MHWSNEFDPTVLLRDGIHFVDYKLIRGFLSIIVRPDSVFITVGVCKVKTATAGEGKNGLYDFSARAFYF